MMDISYRKAVEYLFWACLFSWSLAGAALLFGVVLRDTAGMAMAAAYMFGPLLAALVADRGSGRTFRENVGLYFRFNRWVVVAWLLPVLLAFGGLGIGLLMPGSGYSPEMEGMFERFASVLSPEEAAEMKAQMGAMPIHPIWLAVIQGLVAGATVNAVIAFGEEAGWRGFLLRELGRMGFWRSSLAIGVVWGLWHAPLILQGHNYPEYPVVGVLFMTIFTVLLTPLINYVTLRAGTVLAAAVMHGTVNAVFGISIMLIVGGNDLTVGMTGLAGFAVLAVFTAGLVYYDRRIADVPIDSVLEHYCEPSTAST